MTANIQQNIVPRHRHNNFSLRKIKSSQSGATTNFTLTAVITTLMLVAVTGLGFVYLSQVFRSTSQGEQIRNLEVRIQELSEEAGQLELEGARLRSIQAVEDHASHLELEASAEVAYLAPSGSGRVALHNE